MKRRHGLLLALCGAVLAACGQKGDLYFPDRTREAVSAPAATPTPPAASPTEDSDENARRPQQTAPATN